MLVYCSHLFRMLDLNSNLQASHIQCSIFLPDISNQLIGHPFACSRILFKLSSTIIITLFTVSLSASVYKMFNLLNNKCTCRRQLLFLDFIDFDTVTRTDLCTCCDVCASYCICTKCKLLS